MQRNIRNKPLECKQKEFGIIHGEVQNRPFVTFSLGSIMGNLVLKSNSEFPSLPLHKIRLKSLLVPRTRENHPTLRESANGIAPSSPLRQNQSFEVKFLVPSQKLKWMLKYCSYLKCFLINQLQRYPSRVIYMFRQISYLGPEL